MMYVGAPAVRQQLRLEFNKYNVIITTYDIARKDVDTFAEMRFNYCVLDEGHIIKVCFHIYIYIKRTRAGWKYIFILFPQKLYTDGSGAWEHKSLRQ